jgi:hypothetical protein
LLTQFKGGNATVWLNCRLTPTQLDPFSGGSLPGRLSGAGILARKSLPGALAAPAASAIEAGGALAAPRSQTTSEQDLDITMKRSTPSLAGTDSGFGRSLGRNLGRASLVAMAAIALVSCGKKDRPKADLAASRITTIGVNSYLWRASLEALSFMPLVQTDSNGGVIVTDWYANPNNASERMKVTVTILDQDLRADALRVAASRQTAQNGLWVDAPVQAASVQKLEDVILTKARDLRRQANAAN